MIIQPPDGVGTLREINAQLAQHPTLPADELGEHVVGFIENEVAMIRRQVATKRQG